MAESSYYHFTCFPIKLSKPPKPPRRQGYFDLQYFIERYFYEVEFSIIPNAVLNKEPAIYLAKFPQDKRSEELIKKAQKLGLRVFCVYFIKKDYFSWLNTPKGKEKNGRYEDWVIDAFFKFLVEDKKYYPYKQDNELFH
ncbi:hypothetical protein [Neisseria sp. Ec49-e6-T10]|uniref:hypothetical protein n=1 Tax=Neisseria sp. Ec49-e6-T10 TaxID=3140744 RepID=UPI003EBD9CA4